MTNNVIKKQKEFQSILPLMKVLGYDAWQAESVLIPVEEPDFLFKHEDLNVGIEVTRRDRGQSPDTGDTVPTMELSVRAYRSCYLRCKITTFSMKSG